MFNKKVIQIIEKYGFDVHNILIYLVSLHFNLKPSCIPDSIKIQTNITGIIKRDYNKGVVIWTMPLFNSQLQILPDSDERWEWVNTDYRKLFRDISITKGGDKESCIKKIKQFFAENPDVRKEDILMATNRYIAQFADGTNNPVYMVKANYFISKILKGVQQSLLSEYLEIVKEENPSTHSKKPRGIW